MVYKKVPSDLNFASREQDTLEFWKQNKIFEKSIENRDESKLFTFYDGPPTANGKPHIGHILTRVIKDIIPRYKTMKGYRVDRKAGWDTHGLPVELEVERALKLDGKQDVERYGVAEFNEKCKESVWRYTGDWKEMSDAVGYWCDMDNPYVTYHDEYIESVWWAIKEIADKGLLYKGHKIVPYCPRCGTSLSSHEVAQGYKDIEETSIFVKFKVRGEDSKYLLAWTTTPWTLPSNVALAINPKEEYAEVRVGGESLILAEALVDTVAEDAEVVRVFSGAELSGMEYEPLFDFAMPEKKAFYVVSGDFVTLTDGSGIVHIAPAFGEDDARVGQAFDLPFVQYVDTRGRFTEEVTLWAGMFCKDADPEIIANLESRGLLHKKLAFEHTYPFCWRCDTPLLYYATDTWFIKMTAVKDKLIENNKSINWIPENVRDGRMGHFLENVVDWGLSRSRYWGTPLPVWECTCGHYHVIGSIEELRRLGENTPEEIELHKPYVDEITIVCEKCKESMQRSPDVLDCWFDSGSMPFAQYHYPFENKEEFHKHFPADFISEAIDQTRGWFYTLLAISTLLFGVAPFKNCIVLGHVNDREGQKMSKHKGNVVDPVPILKKQGADAVRWYFYSGSAPWLPSRFYEEAVNESQRKFMGTLWNTYSFFVLYANIDGYNPQKHKSNPSALTVMDRWILSKLNTLTTNIDNNLENYKITESARAIEEFVDELSNWYVRRGRERYWVSELTEDKICAYDTLYTVLVTLSKLIAPFVPFMAESIYQNLVRSVLDDALESVHLCDFPQAELARIDKELEEKMDLVLKIVVLGRACRSKSAIKNRQPLKALYIRTGSERLSEEYLELIKEELNVKEAVFTETDKGFVTYAFKPQLKTVGRKFGKLVPEIRSVLESADGDELMEELERKGEVLLDLSTGQITLERDDLLIETKAAMGLISESIGDISVALDTELNDELIEEGYVRELVNRLQTMRKEAGFEVTDKIEITFKSSELLAKTINKYKEYLSGEVLATSIEEMEPKGHVGVKDINGEEIVVGLIKS